MCLSVLSLPVKASARGLSLMLSSAAVSSDTIMMARIKLDGGQNMGYQWNLVHVQEEKLDKKQLLCYTHTSAKYLLELPPHTHTHTHTNTGQGKISSLSYNNLIS